MTYDDYLQSEDETDELKKNVVKESSKVFRATEVSNSFKNSAENIPKRAEYNKQKFEDRAKMNAVKEEAFAGNKTVKHRYSDDTLHSDKQKAINKYGTKNDATGKKVYNKHTCQVDHVRSEKSIYDKTKNNPFLSDKDVKDIINTRANLQETNGRINQSKQEKSNWQYVKEHPEMETKYKARMIKDEVKATVATETQIAVKTTKGAARVGCEAGIKGAQGAAQYMALMSGANNIVAVVKGEKTTEEALKDTAKDTGVAAASGFVTNGGGAIVAKALGASNNAIVQGLTKSSAPAAIITAITVTGDSVSRWAKGEITTQECILSIGEKGINFAATSYASAVGVSVAESILVGQTLIPVPVVGAVVGALIGSAIMNGVQNELTNALEKSEFEHQERLRIIAECEQLAKQERQYRAELETHLESYFKEYRECFDTALATIDSAFVQKDSDGIVAGANQITEKLGGEVKYKTVKEARKFIFSDEPDCF